MVRAADSDNFLIQHTDFSLREQVNYPNGGISRFYDNGIDMVIIDENICDHNPGEPVFSYMLITDKQNSYIHQFKRVFRFLGYIQSEVDSYLANDEMTLPEDYRITVGDRAEQTDASPLEIHFEDSFSNAYGMNALRYLTREYGICDENGNNYFLDYFIRTQIRYRRKWTEFSSSTDYRRRKIQKTVEETEYLCFMGNQTISIFTGRLRI